MDPSPAPFSVTIHSDGTSSQVCVTGDVDAAQATVLGGLLEALIGTSRQIHLDLGAVNYFGVAATDVVVALQRQAAVLGAGLHLEAVPRAVANLLDLVDRARISTDGVDERRLSQLVPEEFDEVVAKAGLRGREGVCITSADLDEPGPEILVVNAAFTEITGYRADEVLGRNPRFLQGPLSDRRTLDRLRADLENGRVFEGEIINYRADGSPFVMNWRIVPVRSAAGRRYNVALQRDNTEMRSLRRFERAIGYLNGHLDAVDPGEPLPAVLDALCSAVGILLEDGTAAARVRTPDGRIRSSTAHRATALDSAVAGQVAATGRVRCLPAEGMVVAPLRFQDGATGVVVVNDLHPDRIRLASPALIESLTDHAAAVIERTQPLGNR